MSSEISFGDDGVMYDSDGSVGVVTPMDVEGAEVTEPASEAIVPEAAVPEDEAPETSAGVMRTGKGKKGKNKGTGKDRLRTHERAVARMRRELARRRAAVAAAEAAAEPADEFGLDNESDPADPDQTAANLFDPMHPLNLSLSSRMNLISCMIRLRQLTLPLLYLLPRTLLLYHPLLRTHALCLQALRTQREPSF